MTSVRERAMRLVRSPLAWIVFLAGLVRVVGIAWGLPASDGWDNDGVAPRDFLAGLIETVTPGHFFTYPPVHLALLAVLTSPVTIVALVRAPSLAAHDVVQEIVQVPYMTANALVARVVSVAMSLAIVVFVARIAEELRAGSLGGADVARDPSDLRSRRAGICAAAFAAINVSLTYYAHTSNLDVPYLFWATASLLVLVRAFVRRDIRRFRRAFTFAVLAVGTKDQAYGLFLLSVPISIFVFAAWDGWARAHRRELAREVLRATGIAIALLVVVDGVVVNPSGFRARLGFLVGSASKDFVEYADDWHGRLALVRDAAALFERYYPNVLTLIALAGVALVAVRASNARREDRGAMLAASTLPLLAALSFTVTFNWTARRTDHRFFLPQAIVLAIYGGLALEPLVFAARRSLRIAAQAALSVLFARAIHGCLAVDAQLLLDPRYDAEAWLREHVKPGETIETYGLNVYLPRFPPWARVVRVGPEALERRNPLPNVVEVQAPYENAGARNARFIVLTGGWMWRYLIDPNRPLDPGQIFPPGQRADASDPAATRFFQRLTQSLDEYAFVHGSDYTGKVFPRLDIHASTSRVVFIYERKPGR